MQSATFMVSFRPARVSLLVYHIRFGTRIGTAVTRNPRATLKQIGIPCAKFARKESRDTFCLFVTASMTRRTRYVCGIFILTLLNLAQEDEKRILTPLGRQQAELTGKRIAEMMKGAEDEFGPCHIKALRVSGMTRARETAEIIAQCLPGVQVEEPDPMINEGRYVRRCYFTPSTYTNPLALAIPFLVVAPHNDPLT